MRLAEVVVPTWSAPDPAAVHSLADSAAYVGRQVLPTVTREGELVEGQPRLAAVPTVLERGRLLARRKAVYEAIHPEAREHVRGGVRRMAAAAGPAAAEPAPPYTRVAAALEGSSERSVREAIRIAQDLAPDAARLIESTPLADQWERLVALTRAPAERQAPIARLLLAGRAGSVRAATLFLRSEGRRRAAGPGALALADRVLAHVRAAEVHLSSTLSSAEGGREGEAARKALGEARVRLEALRVRLQAPGDAGRLPWPRSAEDGTPLGIDLAARMVTPPGRPPYPDSAAKEGQPAHEAVRALVLALLAKRPLAAQLRVDVEDLIEEVYIAILRKNKQNCAWDRRRASFSKYITVLATGVIANVAGRASRNEERHYLVADVEVDG